MAVVWSNDKIMQLIELFQSKPLLWDCSIKQYKDRNKKKDAFEEISQVINIPKKDVETKIHVLRTQFTREKKKMSAKKTTGSGAKEKCKWIYYEPLEFLLCGATTSGETDTMNKTVSCFVYNCFILLSVKLLQLRYIILPWNSSLWSYKVIGKLFSNTKS